MGTTTLLNLWRRRRKRQRGLFPPGTPKAIREALVCWYDPARQGATNEKMAENPVLKDLSGNGHDAACNNFAWSGMSGIGLYRMKPRALTGLRCEAYEIGDYKYKCVNVMEAGIILYSPSYALGLSDGDPVTVRITGLPEGATLRFNTTGYITATKDGVHSGRYEKGTYGDSVSVSEEALGATITVEFLPEYPGALVADGVDDYGVAEGLPILADYTVIAKRAILTENPSSLKAIARMDGVFIFNIGNGKMASSFGVATYNLPELPPEANVVWQTKDSRNGKTIQFGEPPGEAAPLLLFGLGNLHPSGFLSCALWSFLLFNRTLTAEEIEWVKENMVNGYPSPVAYYDCSKYSNGDMGDNPVLEDLSGNGNDLELHNFAFGGMSGFGGYNWNFNNFIRATYPHTDSTVRFDLSNPPDSYANEFTGYISPSSVPAVLKGVKIKVSGISNSSFNLYCQINLLPSGSVRKEIAVDKDGTYEFPDVDLSQYEKINNVYYGISHLDTTASDIIDVELIPEYPGGLVFDGVDDYGANGNFPSFNCKTLMMLFKHGNANAHKIYFDCRLDASTEYAVLFDTENIAFQARNKNGKTYINNKLNDSLRPKDLVDKKYLVAITNGSAEKGTMIKFGGNNTDASGYYANMVLYKALLFGKVLTQEQMDKVIQDYGLMEGVDDVWNEQ